MIMKDLSAITEEQREELIKFNRAIIAQYESYAIPETSWPGEVRLLVSSARIALAALTADGWIKCSERMPEEHQSTDYVSEEVLVFTSDGEVEISFTDYGRWNCLELVTHWMPLPAPPEASNEQR